MKVSLIQGNIVWESPKENIRYYSEMIKKVSKLSKLVVLPEAFTSGFTMNPTVLSHISTFPVLDWMTEKAFETNKTIAGAAFVKEGDKYFNRLFWVNPDGSYTYYDKRHLFSMGGENKIFTPGNKRVIVELEQFKFNLQICYDLRFPVWNANRYDKERKEYEYDVLLIVANWPAKRKNAYLPLLRTRAIENQSYVLWVNRIGRDGSKTIHSGDTRIIHPSGQVLATVKSNHEGILEYDLSKNLLKEYRKEFPVGPDMDDFEIKR
jgi:predicted amidohydrolase